MFKQLNKQQLNLVKGILFNEIQHLEGVVSTNLENNPNDEDFVVDFIDLYNSLINLGLFSQLKEWDPVVHESCIKLMIRLNS